MSGPAGEAQPEASLGAMRGFVEADDLGVQVRPVDFAGQGGTVPSCPPAVVPEVETSNRRAIRPISKFAYSTAINANLSALVDQKRSTLQLFPGMLCPLPVQRPGGTTSTARSARPRSRAPLSSFVLQPELCGGIVLPHLMDSHVRKEEACRVRLSQPVSKSEK